MQKGFTQTKCSLLQNIKYSFPFITTVNTSTVQFCFTRATIIFNPLNAELNPICHMLALWGAHPILHVSRIWVNHSVPYFIIVQLTSNTVSHFSYKVSDWKGSQAICLKETCQDTVCDFTDKITHTSHTGVPLYPPIQHPWFTAARKKKSEN
jgi:hypothetical protein